MTNGSQERPLVSIGLPVYNEERHLAAALDSLLAQDYENIEVVISDNASTDRTPDICAAYAARDRRVRYHRNETNVGGIENFNRALAHARGEFFMWAAGHDVRHPAQVSRCLRVLIENPAVVLCYSQVVWVDDEGQPLGEVREYLDTRGIVDKVARLNVVLWGLNGGFLIYGLFRTEALRQTAVYTQVISPDIFLLVELAAVGEFGFVPDPPFYLRRPEDYGSWEVYVAKHFKEPVSGWGAQKLYWRMIYQLSTRVGRHMRSRGGKALAAFFVSTAMLIKFRWMLSGLRALKSRPPAARLERATGADVEKAG